MKRLALWLSAVAFLLTACSGNRKPDRVTRDLLSLPKEELFAKGNALLAKRKLDEARKYLNFVFESYPNDPLGQKALLLVADSFFRQRTLTGYLEARYRYRDYVSRYPSAPDRDFALYRYALCYDREHETPDRDPTNTREAINQYGKLIAELPGSSYAPDAKVRFAALNDVLAEHEFSVGFFYYRKGDPSAALGRFRYAAEHYPQFHGRDKLLFYTARSLERLGRRDEAARSYTELATAFPASPWTERMKKEGRAPVDKPVEKS